MHTNKLLTGSFLYSHLHGAAAASVLLHPVCACGAGLPDDKYPSQISGDKYPSQISRLHGPYFIHSVLILFDIVASISTPGSAVIWRPNRSVFSTSPSTLFGPYACRSCRSRRTRRTFVTAKAVPQNSRTVIIVDAIQAGISSKKTLKSTTWSSTCGENFQRTTSRPCETVDSD